MQGDIIGFYEGKVPNQIGMTFDDVRNMTFEEMEKNHHYIQWIFPDTLKSKAVPTSPILTNSDREVFSLRSDLQAKMYDMFNRMLNFYGFVIEENKIRRADDFEKRIKNWLSPRNHNYKRLTRIMRSLRLLRQPQWANALHACLEDVYDEYESLIGPVTKQFWDEAISEILKKN